MNHLNILKQNPDNAEKIQLLIMDIDREIFAINIKSVKEIVNYKSITPMPLTPDFIHGVINLRGMVLPVIDLSCFLHHKSAQINARTCILIVEIESENESQHFGLLVDCVYEVLECNSSQIDVAPQFGSHLHKNYIFGVIHLNQKFILILDETQMLNPAELSLKVKDFKLPQAAIV